MSMCSAAVVQLQNTLIMVFRVQDNTKAQRGQITSSYVPILWLTELCWFLQGNRISSNAERVHVPIPDLSAKSLCYAPLPPENSERYLLHSRSRFWYIIKTKNIYKCWFLLYLFPLCSRFLLGLLYHVSLMNVNGIDPTISSARLQ